MYYEVLKCVQNKIAMKGNTMNIGNKGKEIIIYFLTVSVLK